MSYIILLKQKISFLNHGNSKTAKFFPLHIPPHTLSKNEWKRARNAERRPTGKEMNSEKEKVKIN